MGVWVCCFFFLCCAAKVWFSREETGEKMETIPGRLFPSLFGVRGRGEREGKKGSIFFRLCFSRVKAIWEPAWGWVERSLRAPSSKAHPKNIRRRGGGTVSASAAPQQWGSRKNDIWKEKSLPDQGVS